MKVNFRRQYKIASYVYSQCDVPLDILDKHLKEKAGNKFGWHLIVSADHAENTTDENKHCGVHRHVHEEYSKKPDITNSRHWDIEWNGKVYHPHVEKVVKRPKHIKYCLDQATDRIVSGMLNGCPVDLDAILQSDEKKQSYGYHWVATQLKEGKSLDDIDDVAQAFVANNKRKLEDYQTFLEQKKERRIVRPMFGGFDDVIDPNWQQVVLWGNKNFYSGIPGKMPNREPRQQQLLIVSKEHGLGKSYPWKFIIREYFQGYDWVTNGHKQSSSIKDCDFILMDEFKGGVTIHDLKELSQMYGVNVPIRYGQDIYFKKNVPLIITSHKTFDEIYTKPEDKDDVASLTSRFLVVHVDTPCYLHASEDVKPPIIVEKQDSIDPLGVDLSFREENLVYRVPPTPVLRRQNAVVGLALLDPEKEDIEEKDFCASREKDWSKFFTNN